MARTVMDAALMLQVIAGHDRHDPTTRTAVVPDYSVALTRISKAPAGESRRNFTSSNSIPR